MTNLGLLSFFQDVSRPVREAVIKDRRRFNRVLVGEGSSGGVLAETVGLTAELRDRFLQTMSYIQR